MATAGRCATSSTSTTPSQAYLALLDQLPRLAGRAFNLGGGPRNAVSLLALLDHLGALLGRPVEHGFADWRVGDQRYYVSDTRGARGGDRLARPGTGWRPGRRAGCCAGSSASCRRGGRRSAAAAGAGMRVALLNPPWSFAGSIYFGCREPHLPLELGYCRSLLEAGGHEVLMLDGALDGLDDRGARRARARLSRPTWRCSPRRRPISSGAAPSPS